VCPAYRQTISCRTWCATGFARMVRHCLPVDGTPARFRPCTGRRTLLKGLSYKLSAWAKGLLEQVLSSSDLCCPAEPVQARLLHLPSHGMCQERLGGDLLKGDSFPACHLQLLGYPPPPQLFCSMEASGTGDGDKRGLGMWDGGGTLCSPADLQAGERDTC
jgi:hypothetical protein